MSSLAVESDAMSSANSACSAFRCSVASATDLSKATIPASKAFISSANATRPSSALAIAASACATLRSWPFLASSVTSSSLPQYSFLLSSSTCSFLSKSTIPSIILTTFSKPPFLPLRAKAKRSRRGRKERSTPRAALWTAAKARARTAAVLPWICMKLAVGLGSVDLKRSRASSSLRTLIVSANAASSSLRVFMCSSCSVALVMQPVFNSARNFLSSSKAASVSLSSSLSATISTANSPIFLVFASMAAMRADTSLVLAAMSSS
mmetsp:Transcript_4652/g.10529  ORF Transcript_4652/g.10529 Transcript_4652/m.10529 type:complete len:265 (+) Transcript_4652:35-829(+)